MYFEYLKRLFRKSYIDILDSNATGIIDFPVYVFRAFRSSNTFQNPIFTLTHSDSRQNINT